MNGQIEYSFLEKIVPPIISLIFTGVLSLVIGIFLERFRTRQTIVKYEMNIQPIASSSQSEHWGNIAVYHNGRQINHLSLLTYEIENASNTDLENVTINIGTDNRSQFLAQSGYYNKSNTPILLQQSYFDYFSSVLKRNDEDLQEAKMNPLDHERPQSLSSELSYVMTNKVFFLPAFNRGEAITLNLLVENIEGNIPQGFISIIEKSLVLERKEDSDQELKTTLKYTIVIGVVIYLIVYTFLFINHQSALKPLLISFFLGFLYTGVGFVMYKGFVFLKRQFS